MCRPGGSPGATLQSLASCLHASAGNRSCSHSIATAGLVRRAGLFIRGVTEGRRPEVNATGEVFTGGHAGAVRGAGWGLSSGELQRDSQAQEGCHEGVAEALCSPVGLSLSRPQERWSVTDVGQTAQPLRMRLTLLLAGGNPESLLGVGFVVTAASRLPPADGRNQSQLVAGGSRSSQGSSQLLPRSVSPV